MNTPQTSDLRADELLAVRCQLGERAAFDALITRWHEPLWRYLRRLANSEDTARDLVQDTWLRVLRGIGKLREPAKLRSWMFGIARRAAMDRLRYEYARRSADEVELDELAADEPTLYDDADFATLDSTLAGLPPMERETLTLFYLRELTLPEMAAMLEVPLGTVKSRLFRARQILRRALENQGALS